MSNPSWRRRGRSPVAMRLAPLARALQLAPLASVAGLALISSFVHAADAPQQQPQQQSPALAASGQGNAQQTFAQLSEEEAARAGDPVFDEAMGRAAYAAGQYSRAVMAWERLVATQPDNTLAQVELARALYAVGDRRGVLALSEQARARAIPVDAALSIDQFLLSYDRLGHEGRSTWKGHLDATLGRDSNVNAGPGINAPAFSPPGTPAWTLAPGAQARQASYAALLGNLRGRHVLDARWSLIGAATAEVRGHTRAARPYDSEQLDLSAGVAYREERHEWMLSAQGATYRLDGNSLRNIGGLLGEWIYRLDGFRQWDSFVQVQGMRYPTQSLRDARRAVAGTSYVHVLRNGSLFYTGLYAGQEAPRASGVDALGHDLVGWRGGVQWAFSREWAAFTHLNYERRHYGAADPFFGVTRHDRQSHWVVGVSWLPTPGWRITPQWSMTRNASNLPITDYDRHVFSVTLRREF